MHFQQLQLGPPSIRAPFSIHQSPNCTARKSRGNTHTWRTAGSTTRRTLGSAASRFLTGGVQLLLCHPRLQQVVEHLVAGLHRHAVHAGGAHAVLLLRDAGQAAAGARGGRVGSQSGRCRAGQPGTASMEYCLPLVTASDCAAISLPATALPQTPRSCQRSACRPAHLR